MPINVTCPSCLKRFQVSEKFAGKSGPCPNCQKPIKIPEKTDEVVIHAPADAGPKDSKGKSVLNPIKRKEVKVGTPVIVAGVLVALAMVAIAFGMGLSGSEPHTAVLVIGAILIALPLAFLGYWFLQNDELEGYNGQQLLVRCGVAALGFAALWAIYGFIPRYVHSYASMSEYSGLDMVIFFPIMILLGTLISVAALELEFVQGALHYVLYLGFTFLLGWLAGTNFSAPLTRDNSGTNTSPPPAVSPGEPVPNEPRESERKQIPNMLQ